MNPVKDALIQEFRSLLRDVQAEWDSETLSSIAAAAEDYAQLKWLVISGHDEVAAELEIAKATLSNFQVAANVSAARLMNEAVLRLISKVGSFVLEAAV